MTFSIYWRPSVRLLSVVRPSTVSNNFSSEAVRPILSILHIKHLQVGGLKVMFLFQTDKNSGALATYSFRRLIIGKVEITNFC